jgi:putative membrane protein
MGILLSDAGLVAALAAAMLITCAELTRSVSLVASFLPVGLGAILGTWRLFSAEYGTTVADAPDGLRLRSGLIQTSAETIRPGRVQAVRLVEPLIWRALGWCRLEVDIAGPREHGEDRTESRRLRRLIPVGSRADADQLLAELLVDRPLPLKRPPAAARWKAPLLYRFLGWGGDERYVVASHGRVGRKTTWIPLEKVQSIRWVQGPVQRRLGLATIRLDVAGRRVTGDLQDRGVAEAAEILSRLPDLAREARARRG